jgi:hypothetical protein
MLAHPLQRDQATLLARLQITAPEGWLKNNTPDSFDG